MNYINDIKLNEKGGFNIIIEIPKGTNSKYELVDGKFDKVVVVRKVIGRYPFYYGCFPQTYAGDKDPLDVILLSKKKRNILDIVNVQPITVIKTIDKGEQDDKVVCIASDETITKLDKLEKKAMKFLKTYKGKKADTQIDEIEYDVEEALNVISKANKAYQVRKSNKSVKIDF